MQTKCCSILLLPWPAASAVFGSMYSIDHLYHRPECVIYDQKMKRFWNECPLLFFSTEEALEVSGTLSFALAQPAGALITQPRSAVASAVLQTIMGNILSLGNEGSTDTNPAAAAGQELCHPPITGPGTELALVSAGSKFPEKNFSAQTKSGINVDVFWQYSLFFYK